MKRLLLLQIILTISCNTKPSKPYADKEIKIVKRYDYRIDISTWNGFTGYETEFRLDNTRIDTYDSVEAKVHFPKPLTLYFVSFHLQQDVKNNNIRRFVPTDTVQIVFSKSLSDTLFLLTKDFFKSLDFENYDTFPKTTPVIYDDSHGKVKLDYDGRRLSSTISSINNPTIATLQLDTLLHFVYKFEPIKK